MRNDLRGTPEYVAVEEHLRRVHEPAFGRPTALRELTASPDGERVAVCGVVLESLEAPPRTGIFGVESGSLVELHPAEGSSFSPAYSPNGETLAFRSDRDSRGLFQAYLDGGSGEPTPVPPVPGSVEYLRWSPDSRHLLLGVADPGADRGVMQGSGTTASPAEAAPAAWLPRVVSTDERAPGRSVWVHSLVTGATHRVPTEQNVWDADWCGPDHLVAIASAGPEEDEWYHAPMQLIQVETGATRELYRSDVQLALPTGSPEGGRVAVIEGISSDRGLLAGALTVIEVQNGEVVETPALDGDISHIAWIDDDRIGCFGLRRVESIVGVVDVTSAQYTELVATAGSLGGTVFYPAGVVLSDDTVLSIHEAYDVPQRIVRTSGGQQETLSAVDHDGTAYLRSRIGSAEVVHWDAPDGLEIDGILCRPEGEGPFPLVMHIHGGPVWAFRQTWGMSYPYVSLLVSRGYAVLSPNPRGSSGRGRAFAERVIGDMGGGDAEDLLAGVTAMVERGIADESRLGLIGGSYGGFMSSWLVTRDTRFAAAVPMSPVTDWYSQSLTSNIGVLRDVFLQADLEDPGSHAHTRSPALNAAGVRTPCLNVAGALDLATPPAQAEEFHRALQYHGVPSTLVIYPQEGHGVRLYPAVTDFLTRAGMWFEKYMPARRDTEDPRT
ncbi:S9 family peptidase [Microbacterium sp. W4I20]|uniref:S9 family peptidase n=1 Tax=Microbacterium sp. W4I20 TaxID=3042262 RepID=UPI00278426C6|nr:S9 family peptidase [Microbacterium sp. W4I20]MDQ0726627.1 dipeptidyl aminopeptidase/acylaminoacyl peptidase [Microbacterium sp. W4I20]